METTVNITPKTAKEIINMISPDTVSFFAKQNGVDFHARKLMGDVFLKLLIVGQLFSDRNSQRKMSTLYSSKLFQTEMPDAEDAVSHCSISKRLGNCNPEFFKDVYGNLLGMATSVLGRDTTDGAMVYAVDSSLVRATAKMACEHGNMTCGPEGRTGEKRRQIKYTMIADNLSAVYAKLHTLPAYISEDLALNEAINDYAVGLPKADLGDMRTVKEIFAFDRGLKRSSYIDSIARQDYAIVCRVSRNRHFKVIKRPDLPQGDLPEGVVILEDVIVRLPMPKEPANGERGYFSTEFRLVKADLGKEIGYRKGTKRKVEREIWILTDITDPGVTAAQLLEIYKDRWKIEVFFRFLKQNLNLSHLISLNENGLTIMMYVTLITALLLELYCRFNSCRGENGKFKLRMELIDEIITESEELATEKARLRYKMQMRE